MTQKDLTNVLFFRSVCAIVRMQTVSVNRTSIIPQNVLNKIVKGGNYDHCNNKALKWLVWHIHFIALSSCYIVSHLRSESLGKHLIHLIMCSVKLKLSSLKWSFNKKNSFENNNILPLPTSSFIHCKNCSLHQRCWYTLVLVLNESIRAGVQAVVPGGLSHYKVSV